MRTAHDPQLRRGLEVDTGKSASIRQPHWRRHLENAHRVLLKNSASSRPQGRDADYSLKWISAAIRDFHDSCRIFCAHLSDW
jgi:hypothetical protein